MKLFSTSKQTSAAAIPSHLLNALGREGRVRAQSFLTACPMYTPTPLISLPLAGVAWLGVRDDSDRLGLGSFKALGGAYAVMSLAITLTAQIGVRLARRYAAISRSLSHTLLKPTVIVRVVR